MSGLRIFISHSAKTEAAKTLLNRLYESLKDKHKVWLDKFSLQPGEAWYHSINWCIGYCNAAILLLSEDALKSRFVAYEVSILTFRRRRNPDFQLLPICVPHEVDEEAIEKSQLSPCHLSNFQMIKGNDNDIIINCLHNHLNNITQSNTPLDRPIEELCELLDPISERILEEEAKKLNIELNGWILSTDLKRRLASKMLAVGLDGSAKTIYNLKSRFPSDKQAKNTKYMIDLIGSSWVNYHSAKRIWEAAMNMKEKKILCVNGNCETTAKLYVIWACICDSEHCGRPSYDCWQVVNYDEHKGEKLEGETSIDRHKIKQALYNKLVGQGQIDEERLDETLKFHADTLKEPVFVVMRSNCIDRSSVQDLITAFPKVTFFLLTGFKPDDALLNDIPNIELLSPPLEEDDESKYCMPYEKHSRQMLQICKI